MEVSKETLELMRYQLLDSIHVSGNFPVAMQNVVDQLSNILGLNTTLLATVITQLNEGLSAICNECQQLTYSTSAFVCLYCNQNSATG